MKSILFLSWLLTNAETHYWPTELEVTDIVWVVKKVCHMIEITELTTIIYTDHSAVVSIVQQFSLNTTAVEMLNLWLVHVSEYLQWFCLNIHYKPDLTNIVPDTLSCLTSHEYWPESDKFTLNTLHAFTVSMYTNTLVELSFKFQTRVLEDYTTKTHWQHMTNMIWQNDVLNSNTTKLLYTWIQGLLYYKNIKKGYCLCISTSLYKKVFIIAHNFMKHHRYTHTHKWLMNNLYLSDLSKHLHKYVCYCLQCQLMQTPHHWSYESMQSIIMPSQSFHVITIDFILKLLTSLLSEKFDTVLSVTDKFSKQSSSYQNKKQWQWRTEL